jgi:hypothetical protein
MVILLSIVAGGVFWVVAWALGIKGFDAFLVFLLIVLLAATWELFKKYLPGYRPDPDEPGSGRSWIGR